MKLLAPAIALVPCDRDSASDWFGVAIDSVHDRRTAHEFRRGGNARAGSTRTSGSAHRACSI